MQKKLDNLAAELLVLANRQHDQEMLVEAELLRCAHRVAPEATTLECAADCIAALRLERDNLNTELNVCRAFNGAAVGVEAKTAGMKAIQAALVQISCSATPARAPDRERQRRYLEVRGWGSQQHDYWRDRETGADFHLDQALSVQINRDLLPFQSLLKSLSPGYLPEAAEGEGPLESAMRIYIRPVLPFRSCPT